MEQDTKPGGRPVASHVAVSPAPPLQDRHGLPVRQLHQPDQHPLPASASGRGHHHTFPGNPAGDVAPGDSVPGRSCSGEDGVPDTTHQGGECGILRWFRQLRTHLGEMQ